MQVRMVVLPSDDGINVVLWGKWVSGSMRVRHFENRTEMVSVLVSLGLISAHEVAEIESLTFAETCPLFSAEIEEEILVAHDFELAG